MASSRPEQHQKEPAPPEAEAAAWFARLRADDAGPQDRADFAAWRRTSAANAQAFAELERLWAELDHLPRPALAIPPRPAVFSRRRLLAGSAGLAAAAATLAVFGLPDALVADHWTATGEIRTIVLADGSAVQLDADTALSVRFEAGQRAVRLHRGRALFRVAPDAIRPFRVLAAAGSATALGTAFVVERQDGEVTVTVVEHRVRVAAGEAAVVDLDQGQRVSYGPAGLGLPGNATGEEDAWSRGRLVFVDRPLGLVVAEINRYRSGRILVTDGALNSLRVSGAFDVTRPDLILDAITATLPVRALRLTPYLVLLHPA